jgi:hypothetical protein
MAGEEMGSSRVGIEFRPYEKAAKLLRYSYFLASLATSFALLVWQRSAILREILGIPLL